MRASNLAKVIVVLGLSLCNSCGTSDSGPGAIGPRPNIVLFVADDLGWGDLSSYNPDSKIATPHIDSLADSGISFADAHTSTPMCAPSRYSILTGNYPFRGRYKFGQWSYFRPSQILPDQQSLGDILTRAGYRTHFVGKLHMGGDFYAIGSTEIAREESLVDFSRSFANGPIDFGFQSSFLVLTGIQSSPYAFFENDRLLGNPDDLVMWDKGTYGRSIVPRDGIGMPSWDSSAVGNALLNNALAFIQESVASDSPDAPAKPFFLYYAAQAAHYPYTPPEFMDGQAVAGSTGMTPHADMIVEVDIAVGALLKALETSGVRDNTLFIFTSDNGGIVRELEYGHDATGAWRGEKGDLWEGGHRVPFIWSWPASGDHGFPMTAGSTSHHLVAVQDTVATVSSLLDVPTSRFQHLDSLSLVDVLRAPHGEKTGRTDFLVILYNGSDDCYEYALRSGDWKLLIRETSDGVEISGLYNLSTDPEESIDLAGDTSVRDVQNALYERYLTIINSTRTNE